MTQDWQPISIAPKNDERIIVAGATWIRGNKQQLPPGISLPGGLGRDRVADRDNEGPRALIRGPKFWMAIPPLQMSASEGLGDTTFL